MRSQVVVVVVVAAVAVASFFASNYLIQLALYSVSNAYLCLFVFLDFQF